MKWSKGAFNNYVDRFLPFFDHPGNYRFSFLLHLSLQNRSFFRTEKFGIVDLEPTFGTLKSFWDMAATK